MVAVLAIVLIGAMVSAVVFATTEDTKVAAIRDARQIAMIAAESALTTVLSNESPVMPDSIGVSGGQIIRGNGAGPSVLIYLTRLDSTVLWIVADVLPDANHSGARRRIGILGRIVGHSDGSIGIAPVSQRAWSELF